VVPTYFAATSEIRLPTEVSVGAGCGAMNGGGKTWWKAIQVHDPGGGRALEASERLAALYRFQNGEVLAGYRFTAGLRSMGEPPLAAVVTDPADVDWEAFPILAALEAVTCDELRRLRALLQP
jgi:hypothetical protein